MTTNLITRPVAVRTLRILAAVLAVVTVYKFLAIAVDVALAEGWRPQVLPWGFLVVISGPFVAATVLIGQLPRSGTAVLMLASAVFVTVRAAEGRPACPGHPSAQGGTLSHDSGLAVLAR
jgi:hypothetical protein